MALEGEEGFAGVYIDNESNIFLSQEMDLTAEKLNEMLKSYKITVSEVKKNDEVQF